MSFSPRRPVPVQSTSATILQLFYLVDVSDPCSIPPCPGGLLRKDVGSPPVTPRYAVQLALTILAGNAIGGERDAFL
jgi:hypothetical protein